MDKREFIHNDIWVSTFYAAFQRIKIYKDSNVSDVERKAFREGIKEYVNRLVQQYYINGTDDEQHIKNIEDLCNWVSNKYGGILRNNKLTFGVAQKILNLHLKFLWCLNEIREPPHCPFNSKILGNIREPKRWCEFDIDDYKRVVLLAKQEIKTKSLAEWELEKWCPT